MIMIGFGEGKLGERKRMETSWYIHVALLKEEGVYYVQQNR